MVLEVFGYGSQPQSLKKDTLKAVLEIVEQSIEEKRAKGWKENPVTVRFENPEIEKITFHPSGMVDVQLIGGEHVVKHLSQFNLAETYEIYQYLRKKVEGDSMFYDVPRHPELAEITSIKTPEEARKSVRKLLELARRSPRDYRVAIKKAMVLTANRSRALLKKENISAREKGELREVARIYEEGARKIIIPP